LQVGSGILNVGTEFFAWNPCNVRNLGRWLNVVISPMPSIPLLTPPIPILATPDMPPSFREPRVLERRQRGVEDEFLLLS